MFRFECCNGKRNCKVYVLANSPKYQQVLLKIGICSKCKRITAIIERLDYYGNTTYIRKSGIEAYNLFNNNKPNILYELKRLTGKSGWSLAYYEYGKEKRCHSNLRTLRLGLIDHDFTIYKPSTIAKNSRKLAC